MGHEMCGFCNCVPCECDEPRVKSMLDDNVMLELIKKSHLENNLPIPVAVMDWENLSYERKYELFYRNFVMFLQNKLHGGWIGVKFTKINGESRDMVCTLKYELLPKKSFNPKDKIPKPKNQPDVIAVWSRDDEAWRSFRLDSIKELWGLTPFVVR